MRRSRRDQGVEASGTSHNDGANVNSVGAIDGAIAGTSAIAIAIARGAPANLGGLAGAHRLMSGLGGVSFHRARSADGAANMHRAVPRIDPYTIIPGRGAITS